MEYKSKEELLKEAEAWDKKYFADIVAGEVERTGQFKGNSVYQMVNIAYESGKQEGLKEKPSDPFMGFKIGDKVYITQEKEAKIYKIELLFINDVLIPQAGCRVIISKDPSIYPFQNIFVSQLSKVPDSPEAEKPEPIYDYVKKLQKEVQGEIDRINDRLVRVEENLFMAADKFIKRFKDNPEKEQKKTIKQSNENLYDDEISDQIITIYKYLIAYNKRLVALENKKEKNP